jgi:methyl-accepting chemotaxis protein
VSENARETTASAISHSTNEQITASQEVANNMEKITQLIDDNLQSSKSAGEATNDLFRTSGSLRQLVKTFRIFK